MSETLDNHENSVNMNFDEVSTDEQKSSALQVGWKDLPDFTGDPEKWKPAKDYLEQHDNNVGALRKTLQKQQAETQRKLDAMEKVHKQLLETTVARITQEHEQQLAFLKQQRKQARQDGDHSTADEIADQIETLTKEGPKVPKIEQSAQDPEAWRYAPGVPEWLEKNEWVDGDSDLRAFGDAYANSLRSRGDTSTGVAFLNKVSEAVRRAHPDKFPTARRTMVEPGGGGSAQVSSGGGARTFAALPAEAKFLAEQFVKDKLGSKEDYAKLYFSYEDSRKRK